MRNFPLTEKGVELPLVRSFHLPHGPHNYVRMKMAFLGLFNLVMKNMRSN